MGQTCTSIRLKESNNTQHNLPLVADQTLDDTACIVNTAVRTRVRGQILHRLLLEVVCDIVEVLLHLIAAQKGATARPSSTCKAVIGTTAVQRAVIERQVVQVGQVQVEIDVERTAGLVMMLVSQRPIAASGRRGTSTESIGVAVILASPCGAAHDSSFNPRAPRPSMRWRWTIPCTSNALAVSPWQYQVPQ